MNYKLVLRREAEKDLLDGYRWYDDRVPGLGQRFLESVERTLVLVEGEPHAFAEVHEGVHRALTRTFPYGVFYVVEESRVVVLAIVHTARHSRIWMERITSAP